MPLYLFIHAYAHAVVPVYDDRENEPIPHEQSVFLSGVLTHARMYKCRYTTYEHNDLNKQMAEFRAAKGKTCTETLVAKFKAFLHLRKRGEWEENDEAKVLEKMQRRSAAFDKYRLPNGTVVGIEHKSYLDRCDPVYVCMYACMYMCILCIYVCVCTCVCVYVCDVRKTCCAQVSGPVSAAITACFGKKA